MQTVRMRLPQFTALGDKCYEIGGADTCAQTTENSKDVCGDGASASETFARDHNM